MIPVKIGNRYVCIKTYIIDDDIPLLLSNASLKKAQSQLDFANDTLVMYGQVVSLGITTTGHYILSLTPALTVLHKSETGQCDS